MGVVGGGCGGEGGCEGGGSGKGGCGSGRNCGVGHGCGDDGSSSNGSCDSAVLPPCAATVATKTPVATAMVGAQATINNQLKVVMATATDVAMMTVTTTTMK